MISAIRQGRARRDARNEYHATATRAAAVFAELYGTEEPAARAELLRRHAACEGRMAELHRPARICPAGLTEAGRDGGPPIWRPVADVLSASAVLFRLVAETEDALSLSTWANVAELEGGATFLRGSDRLTVVDVFANDLMPELLHVVCAGAGGLVMGAGETVRTDGPDRFAVVELAREHGAGFAEALEWWHLATTRDREHRAELLAGLAILAAERVGARAAESLVAIGDSEVHLACDPGGPVTLAGTVLSHEARR